MPDANPKSQIPNPKSPPARSYAFPASHRLHGSRQFDAVLTARVRKDVGPIAVAGIPNTVNHPRLGLSVPRRVGNAVVRNRVKRLVREAFRICQHDWPQGYDVVVIIRPHKTATLADYQRMLFAGVRGVHQEWERRKVGSRKSGV